MSQATGKIFIITGSARGLGKGFADAILRVGGYVTISDVDDKEGETTTKELQERYGNSKVHYVHCDVTKEEEFSALWDKTEEFFGKSVDVLVNNAGINHKRGWRLCMEIDIMAVLIGCQLAFARMGKSSSNGRGGYIINVASAAGLIPSRTADSVSYYVAKHGVVALTKSLGENDIYKKEGITVNCLCPTFTDTKIVTEYADIKEGVIKRLGKDAIMPVHKVVDAFMTLFEDGRCASALVVAPNIPPFYWPLHDQKLFHLLGVGSAIFGKLFKIRMAVLIGCQLAFARMGKSSGNGRGGYIINVASVAGLLPSFKSDNVSYFAAKHGVVAISKSLGDEDIYRKEGITVNCICPFFTDTNIVTEYSDIKDGVVQRFGKDAIMPVQKVVDAFMTLFEDGKRGSALVVAPKVPPFYWPLHDQKLFYFLAFGSGIFEKLFKIRTFEQHHQLLFTFLLMLFIYYLLKFILCMLL